MNKQDFFRAEAASRDTIDFKRVYADMAGGDALTGLMLSQLVFWNLPDASGKSKMRARHDGYEWVARTRREWWEEIRISPKQADRSLKLLEDLGLIVKAVYKWNGAPTIHVRLNWEVFLARYEAVTCNPPANPYLPQGAKSISPKGQHPISPNGEMDVDETAKSLTETTSENTSETTTDSSARGAAAAGVDEGFSDRPNRESLVEPSTELEKLLAAEWNFTEFTQPMVEALNASMRDKENPTNKHPSANEMYRDTPLFRVWLTDEYLPWAKDPEGKRNGKPFSSAELCKVLRGTWGWWAEYSAENGHANIGPGGMEFTGKLAPLKSENIVYDDYGPAEWQHKLVKPPHIDDEEVKE